MAVPVMILYYHELTLVHIMEEAIQALALIGIYDFFSVHF
jgi:hypothetical protein